MNEHIRAAMRCFEENTRLISPPTSDFVAWNLSNGLSQLAQGISQELAKQSTDIDALRRLVAELARQSQR